MDFCGPYVTSESGNRYILVFIDTFTKYVELVPTPDQLAKTVCQSFYKEIVCRHGTPGRLLSDQGPQFKSELVESLCQIFGIRKIFSSAYYPQGDGLAERFMRTLNNSLAILSRNNISDWDVFVPGVQFAYNSSVNAATGTTPFSLVTGRVPSFPEEGWLRAAHSPKSHSGFLRDLYATVARVHEEAATALNKSWEDLKRRYDAKRRHIALPIGSTVLVRLSDYERGQHECRKLAPRWSDPAEVVHVLSNGKTYGVQRINGKIENINVSRLLPLGPELWGSVELKTPQETPVAPMEASDSDSEEVTVQSVPPPREVPAVSRSLSTEAVVGLSSAASNSVVELSGDASSAGPVSSGSSGVVVDISSSPSVPSLASSSTVTKEHSSDVTFSAPSSL